jgi:hypothetical protein
MTEALRPELFDLRGLAARPSTPGVELERRGASPASTVAACHEQGLKAHRACAIGRGSDDLAADAAVW